MDIKFRVWDNENNRWFKDWIGINNLGVVYDDGHGPEDLSLHGDAVVQLYSGCKDKNGKEIYEGDIIKHTNLGMTREGRIRFYAGAFFAEWDNQMDDMLGYLLTDGIEVVGNIFEYKK